ncbi:FAD-binding protein [Neorickettsia findlayensis]|uniref:UDP-N-acetylenolpyruvoylglucosamine reductase n=1 Tax=Neorickettsia findlayensis TaxID=2686014 RepID=A0A6P1G9Y3_9RICK|nr:FAD-binding protein [Neorickettsia findlayensis]QHD65287.1 FAD-binding protein [Neorickettsia findlayensis]
MRNAKYKLKEVELSRYTRLRVGGKGKLLCATNTNELVHFIKNHDFHVIGAGSNILAGQVLDKPILKLGRGFEYISYADGKVKVGAAVLKSTLARFALDNEIGTFEFFAVMHGTIGSAIAMNASAYNRRSADLLVAATFICENGEILTLSREEIGFENGGNSLPKNYICVEAVFDASCRMEKEKIKLLTLEMLRKSQDFQPAFSEAACAVFQDLPEQKACELVAKAGYVGFSVGCARISEKYNNFIINGGCKTADPLIELCYVVRNGVKNRLGVTLDFSVVFI